MYIVKAVVTSLLIWSFAAYSNNIALIRTSTLREILIEFENISIDLFPIFLLLMCATFTIKLHKHMTLVALDASLK